MAERVFVQKLKRIGMVGVEIVHRQSFGLEQASQYPLFTDEVIQLMRDLIPPERRDTIATSITVTANKP